MDRDWLPRTDRYLPAIKLDLSSSSKTIIVTFAGIGDNGALPFFQFASATAPFPVQKIFIRDPYKVWYHRGLPNIAQNIDDTAAFLNSLFKDLGIEKKIFIGNSMGGYAALLFASLLRADEVHAFSPKTLITPFRRLLLGDVWSWRYIWALQRTRSAQRKYFDLKPVLAKSQPTTQYHIYFSTEKWFDRFHSFNLKSIDNVTLHPFSNGGHFLVRELRDNGRLENILANALGIDPGDMESDFHKTTKN